MKIVCDHCGEENYLDMKKFTSKKSKAKRISHCKSCGRNIFIPVVQRINDYESEMTN